jgi:hypothetical protein
MPDASYFVRLFERRDHDLVAGPPIDASDYVAAIGEAQRRAQEAAGAIVFACTRDQDTGSCSDVQIIIKIGEVPEDLSAMLNADA